MKRLVPILLSLLFAGVLYGQTPQPDAYQQQYVGLYREYAKNPDDVANLIRMAEFFADAANPQFNLPLAYGYIKRAEEIYTMAVQDRRRYREVQKLIRHGVTVNGIRQTKADIESQAMIYVRNHVSQMRPFEVSSFLEAFPEKKEMVQLLRAKSLADAYAQVRTENTINGYYAFCQNYPNSPQADSAEDAIGGLASRFFTIFSHEGPIDSVAALYPASKALQDAAMRQKSRIAYSRACRANNVAAYSDYIEKYPRGDYYLEALARMNQLRNDEIGTLATPEELVDYIESHNDDPMADSAMALLRDMIVNQRNQRAAQVYLSHFPLDPEYANIYKAYYSWFAEEGNRQPIEAFATAHPDFPFALTVKSDLERANRIDGFDLTKPFVEADVDTMTTIIRLLTGRKTAFVALQRILQHQIAHKDWAAACKRMQKFELSFEITNQAEYAELASLLTDKHGGPTAVRYYAADSISNVLPYPESDRCYFLTHRHGRQTLCCASRISGKKAGWTSPVPVIIQGTSSVAVPYCFFAKGSKALLGIKDNIWTARVLNDTLWVLEDPLPSPVNTAYIEKDAFMLEDGSGLLLASDRPGGYNVQKSGAYYHGDTQLATDLYFIPNNNGIWGEAVNLGPQINTAYCEHSPLLSRNMRTLYFVTDARGLGYGDIYCATRTNVNDWSHWSQPVNLGRNVNGAFDESSIAFGKTECQIVVTTATPYSTAASVFATQHDTSSSYRVVEVDFEPVMDVMRNVRMADLSTQSTSYHQTDRQVQPKQSYRLHKEEQYALVVEADWYYVPTLFIDKSAEGGKAASQDYDLKKYSLDELVKLEEPIALPLVRFHEGSSRLLPLAEVELRMLGHFMQQRTVSKLHIAVRTDGSDDRAAYDLSLQRARAVRAFLVDYGIAASRLSIAAYGNADYKKGIARNEVEVKFF